jgi:glycerol-3-phosphate dehydrogenase subunit C
MDLPIRSELDKCIKCGLCTASCPVAGRTGVFAGPKHVGPEMTRFRLDDRLGLEKQVDYCCNCRNCEQACPSGVKISLLNACYRHDLHTRQELKLRDSILSRPGMMAKLGSLHVGATNYALDNRLVRAALDRGLGIARERPLPAYSRENLRKWFQQRRQPGSLPNKAVYFPGCTAEYNQPEIGRSVVNILERCGYQVILPPANCCGLPLAANGFLEDAARLAGQNIKNLLPFVQQGYPVIVSCPTCGLALKSDYLEWGQIFSKNDLASPEFYDLSQARLLAANVYDFSEWLLILQQQGVPDTSFQELALRVAYHTPCHLKAQGIGQPSLEILKQIPALQVIELDEGCCGVSGSFGFKKEKYRLSLEIGARLFNRIREIAPDLVTSDCSSCCLQISHATGIGAVHPAVLMDQAYGKEIAKG